MSELKQLKSGKYIWLFDTQCFSSIDENYFSETYWLANDAITNREKGRGTTLFVQHNDAQLVLRHYLRGGFMSKISKDHYLFSKLERTRSISELLILEQLQALGLPAPKPAAAQVIRSGIYYQADILIHQIPNSKDLVSLLTQAQPSEFYEQLGEVIATFHQQGVFHADLNIKNILQDNSGKFWLIDFDRARIQTPSSNWQNANLKRLKRSFEKEVVRHKICWNEQDWSSLCKGYKRVN